MTRPDQLPFEIYVEIFQFLPREDVYNCITVCKSWNQPAIQTYYQEMFISTKQVKFLKSKLLLKQEEQDQKFDNGHLTVMLKIYHKNKICLPAYPKYEERQEYKSVICLNKVEFLSLLSFFPNLKTLDLSCSIHSDHYMSTLRDNENSIYLNRVEQILPTWYDWKNPFIGTPSAMYKTNFLAYYNFRHTLTRLDLYGYGSHSIDGFSGDNLSLLTHFKNLIRLLISSLTDKDVTLFHVLGTYRNLSCFTFISKVVVPDHAYKELENMIEINGKEATKLTWSTLTHSQHLTCLTIDVPSLTAPYIKYITSCIPSSV